MQAVAASKTSSVLVGTVTNSTIAHNTVVGGDDATTEGDADGGYANGGGIGNLFFANLTVRAVVPSPTTRSWVAIDPPGAKATVAASTTRIGSTMMVYDSDILHNSATGGQDAIGVDSGERLWRRDPEFPERAHAGKQSSHAQSGDRRLDGQWQRGRSQSAAASTKPSSRHDHR